jgi:hypothetical protein
MGRGLRWGKDGAMIDGVTLFISCVSPRRSGYRTGAANACLTGVTNPEHVEMLDMNVLFRCPNAELQLPQL